MTKKEIKLLADKIGEQRLLLKSAEEISETNTRILQVMDGRDKVQSLLLEIGDTITWLTLISEFYGGAKQINRHVKNKLNKLNKNEPTK